jgi:hypothetical protein
MKTNQIKSEDETWINKKWRPAMAWMYMVVCIFDFIIFPVLYTLAQISKFGTNISQIDQWDPLTLMGAGLFHMAMGAILGITAWSRGQEKMVNVGQQNRRPTRYDENTDYEKSDDGREDRADYRDRLSSNTPREGR